MRDGSHLEELPSSYHFEQLRKSATVLYWGTWTLKELQVARSDLFESSVSEIELRDRFERVGGMLRSCATAPNAVAIVIGQCVWTWRCAHWVPTFEQAEVLPTSGTLSSLYRPTSRRLSGRTSADTTPSM